MPKEFSIWIVTAPGYSHTRCFEDQAVVLQAAFAELGYKVPIVTQPQDMRGTTIVLAAILLSNIRLESLPPNLIIYNLEQVQKGSEWITPNYINLLKRYPVWDYSLRNIENLKSLGVENVTLCSIGYMPPLSSITPVTEDADVVFLGSTNPRRISVFEQLAAHGKKVNVGFDIYGKDRDAFIARGKIAINMHYYDAQIFEITRVSYLLANRKCVVSETGFDNELEAPFQDCIAFAPYENLVNTCLKLLDLQDERARLAQKGFECFSAMSQVPILKNILEQLSD